MEHRESDSVGIHLHAVGIKEESELGAITCSQCSCVPVDNTVIVAVDVVFLILRRHRLLEGANKIIQETIALIEAIRNVPVVVDGGRGVLAGSRLTRIRDEPGTENDDDRHDRWEKSAALEAHFLTLALLSETGDFFC